MKRSHWNIVLPNDIGQAYSTITDSLEAVHSGLIDEAIVPIENSYEGTIPEVVDFLIQSDYLRINKEIIKPISHKLVASKEAILGSIEVVFSHKQVLFQCRQWLRLNMPNTALEEFSSTAKAVLYVASQESDIFAAIGSRRSAEHYGVSVIAEDISDQKDNVTRFLVISRKDVYIPPAFSAETTVVFTTESNKPGSLVDVLS